MWRIIVLIVVVLVTLFIIGFACDIGAMEYSRFFSVRRENIRREVFEETKSYNEGKEQDLLKYYHEYQTGNPEEKDALEFTIRHMYADYDSSKLAPELREFLNDILY